MDELGISTPEDLGYDKPELFIPQPEVWWEKKWQVFTSMNKISVVVGTSVNKFCSIVFILGFSYSNGA